MFFEHFMNTHSLLYIGHVTGWKQVMLLKAVHSQIISISHSLFCVLLKGTGVLNKVYPVNANEPNIMLRSQPELYLSKYFRHIYIQ